MQDVTGYVVISAVPDAEPVCQQGNPQNSLHVLVSLSTPVVIIEDNQDCTDKELSGYTLSDVFQGQCPSRPVVDTEWQSGYVWQ